MRNELKLEKKIERQIEKYMNVDFYEDQESENERENERENETPYSLILDLSDVKPGEIEIEDEIKLGYLWNKYHKRIK